LAVVVAEDLAVVPIVNGREEEGLVLLMMSGVVCASYVQCANSIQPNAVPVIDVDFVWNSKVDY
jgi:hypothetical protein